MRQPLVAVQRIIGEFGGDLEGPLIIFLGGIHGNEPAGIIALQHVIASLYESHPVFRGKIAALAGNLSALSRATRYVDYDLNRIWTEERIHELATSPAFGEDPSVDHTEQRELYMLLQDYFRFPHTDVYVIDLHTTSARSSPFTIILDTLRNRKFALNLPVPIILGMEEHLTGTLLTYVDELGYHTLAFEAGQHDDPQSVANHIAAIWILLVSAGCISEKEVPNYHQYIQQLRTAAHNLPPIFEVRYRYAILPGEHFRMRPGYSNFQPIYKGEILARNEQGNILCEQRGNIFMPLYQPQGSDGFFVIRKVQAFWLKVSEWMRKLKMDKLLPFLPGIHRDADHPQQLIINRRIARWLVTDVLHLLGYRQKTYDRNKLIAVKRKFDLKGPH